MNPLLVIFGSGLLAGAMNALVGGAIGAWLLMSTPSTTFDSLLPWLE